MHILGPASSYDWNIQGQLVEKRATLAQLQTIEYMFFIQ